jgi:hypothetical protein
MDRCMDILYIYIHTHTHIIQTHALNQAKRQQATQALKACASLRGSRRLLLKQRVLLKRQAYALKEAAP